MSPGQQSKKSDDFKDALLTQASGSGGSELKETSVSELNAQEIV